MDATTRRTRFENRVLLERDFLSRVNAIFGQAAPLTGMTIGAIESWKMRAGTKTDSGFVAEISKVLIEASVRAELMVDNSKEVFEPDHRPPSDSLQELLDLLDTSLEQVARLP